MNIRQSISFCHLQNISDHEITRCLIRIDLTLSGGAGAVVRSLPSDPKVQGSIPGSAESGIFGALLSC